MSIENFVKAHQIEMIFAAIFAVIAAILIAIFWESIKKFFASIKTKIRALSVAKKFEHRYREWLINKYKFLNVRGIKTKANLAVEIERVFVSLRVGISFKRRKFWSRESPPTKELDSDLNSQMSWLRHLLEWDILLEGWKQRFEIEKNYQLEDLFKLPGRRFVIIGAPGSGKTTLLNYLALKFARKSGKELFGIENELLPICINLRDATKEGFLYVRKFVENYNNYIECPQSPPEDFFKKKLDEGNCIILLDGLDEVASVEQRINVAKWVDELSTAYPKNIYIATSRSYGYKTTPLYNDFLELHILDFTPEQVAEFIRYWTKAVEIKARGDDSTFTLKEAENEADDLIKAIKEHPKIEALTTNPLLLTIVSIVHRYRGHLPERRVELYDECCDVLLFHWDSAKGIAGELKAPQKRLILQPLAFHLHKNGLREEKKEKVIEFLDNELPKIGISKNKTIELLEEIRDRCGILVETKLGYFGFTHPTFQEFLTARYILDNGLENFLLSKKREKYWLEVTLLYCGMKDTTYLLQEILKDKEDIFYTNLFLASICLVESLSVSPKLRTDITQHLFDIYMDENQYDVLKQNSLEALKETKDPQIINKFIENIKDKKIGIRKRAASALGRIQAKEAVLPLIELLSDKESYIRRGAASALGRMQTKEAILPLIELLKDSESVVRSSAADALGQMWAKDAILPLTELLKDKDSDVRGHAASALGQIQAKEAVLPLIELLKDNESEVRGRATSALGQIQAKEVVLALIEILKDEESEVRRRAADALARLQAKEAAFPLVELLKDNDSDVRRRAADALVHIGAKETILPLIDLLKDKDGDVRGNAADALGEMQAKEAFLPLIDLLKDKESDVRGHVAFALGRMRAKEAVLPLINLLKEEEGSVRVSAAYGLGQMQAKEAVLPLIELLKDKEGYVRVSAACGLGQMQAKEAVLPLIELLKDKDGDVRRSAADALGQMQATEAVLPLIDLLKDKESDVRWSAANALGNIGDKNAIENLKLLLNDRKYSVFGYISNCAFNALKEISEKTNTPIYRD